MGEAIQRARARSRRVTPAEALRIRAMILTERSHWQEAEERFRSALRLLRGMLYRRSDTPPTVWAAAPFHLVLGHPHRQSTSTT